MKAITCRFAWTTLAVATVLAGCASAPPQRAPVPNRFGVNGATITLPPDRLEAIRRNWTGDPLAQVANSHSRPVDRRWILDLIALSEELGTQPCHRVAFERLESVPLHPFVAHLDGQPSVTFDPHKYSENWHIDACGVEHRWRVMDDANNPREELTVLMLGGGAPR